MKNGISESDLEKFITLFNAYRTIDQMSCDNGKKLFIMDEPYIDAKIKQMCLAYPWLTDEMCEVIKNRIMATFEFLQEEGEALLSDYSHEDWYPVADQERNYWNRYYNWLKNKNPEFGNKESKFDANTDAITNLLGNPASSDQFHVHGLVMGDVQSGKTGTYIGVITKAVDAGYKVVVLLTGLTESLRRQTQRRINEGFIGYDSESGTSVGVGVGSSLLIPRAMTSTRTDYKGNTDQNTAPAISKLDKNSLILVCKKNVSVLRRVISGLRNLNTSETRQQIDAPLLLIDDEADNASINTNKPEYDPTQINQKIRALLGLFKQASYVGFTATPFANVFIQPTSPNEMEKDDLFPRDFIYSLKAPDNYIGPASIFSKAGKWHSALVNLDDAQSNYDLLPFNHKKDWDGLKLFPSFYDAIIAFCLANAIRDIRGDRTAHRSMLINMSRFIDVQKKIANIAEEYFDDIKKAVKLFGGHSDEVAFENPCMAEIHRVWKKQYEGKVECDWNQVKKTLYSSIKTIKIVVVNSKSTASLDYEGNKRDGLRVIAVGGLALSRGLTLEGLVTSYFYRNTCTYDVLMQMGRWFGYRPNYADLVRIWIPSDSSKWYGEISDAIELMRKDITTMIAHKKTPVEFGIRVRDDSDELGITASNKMRNTAQRIERPSFYGHVFENTFVTSDFKENEHNWDLVDDLSLALPAPDKTVKKPYYRNVSVEHVIKLLEGLYIPKISVQFDREQIVNFLKTTNDKHLEKWDVLIMTKSVGDDEEDPLSNKPISLKNGLVINPIVRTCVEGPEAIAVSGGKSHIGSRDTKYGLTAEQIKKIEKERDAEGLQGTSQKMYMIEGRNPLLIVYAVMPNAQVGEEGKALAKENFKLLFCNRGGRGSYAAFSVAIPSNKNAPSGESHTYVVNCGADYYQRAGFAIEGEDDQ